MVTYGLERDMLPLAELALHHDDHHVIAELTEHCVEAIYLGSPSFHPGHVSSRWVVHSCRILKCTPWYINLSPSMQMDQSLQSMYYKGTLSLMSSMLYLLCLCIYMYQLYHGAEVYMNYIHPRARVYIIHICRNTWV